ncbi:MAG: GntR family transcriptional regulator [Gemmataceae bacterium]|nr:GntR family transcriptional regulator [Gemmataceae bacterium]
MYDALRRQIVEGELAPGTPLRQQALAVSMSTSNGPVISALRRLASEGLVCYEPGNGCRVSDWSPHQLDDRLTVRRALETEAARLAARRAGPEDIERLRQIVGDMADLVRHARWAEADRIDVEVHVAIAQLSRSPGLIEALTRCHLLELVRRRLSASERLGDFQNLAVNHRKLVDAIASGDPEVAGKAMHDHLSSKRPVPRENGL